MKRRIQIPAMLLMWAGVTAGMAFGQLASSHAPTTVAKQQMPAAQAIAQPTGKPLVKINDAVLTDRDLVREEFTIFPYARQHGGNIPPEMEPQIRRGAMQMMVFEELVYQDAKRRGVTVAPTRMQKAEADFRKQFSSQEEYQEYLAAEFQGSEKTLRDKIQRSLLIDTMLKSEVDAKSVVSLTEARAFYDKNGGRFEYAEQFVIQTISMLPPPNVTLNAEQQKELRKRAEDALKQAQATKDYETFGVLAEKISDDDYRVMMGAHKPMSRAQLAPPVLAALDKMKAGEITGVIQVDQAYTIVRLNQHIAAGKVKFEDAKDQLRKELKQKKTEQLRAALDKKLRQNAKIENL